MGTNTTFLKVPLSRILKPIERAETPQPGTMYRLFGVRWWGEGVYEREAVDGSQTQYAKLSRIETNDVVINKIWARHGSVAVVPEHLSGCYGGSEFPTFLPDTTHLEPRWIHWLSRTSAFWSWCAEKSYGTSGKNRIRPEQFLAIEIPLPPLDEQRRIVAHIEALAARIAEARGLRQQAVEEAEALLNRATSQILDSFPSHIYKSIGSVCDVKGGIQKSGDRMPTHNPRRYLTVAHVQRNQIDTGDPRYFEVSDNELERWRLMPGDVLVVEGNGSADQIGRTALFKGEIEDCVHQNHIIRVRPAQTQLQSEFLNHYFNSILGKTAMQEISRTSSGLFHLSVGKIQSLNIPIPSLNDQCRIVAYLDDLHARIDALKRLQAETAAELDALLPAVLDRAFRGELL